MRQDAIHAARHLLGIPAPKTDHEALAKDFVKVVNAIRGTRKPHRVFDDFCEAAYCAFARRTTSNPERLAKLDAQYESVTSGYPDQAIPSMASLMSIAHEALRGGGDDFLGRVCGLLGALDGTVGQFFTPFDASRLCVDLNMPDPSEVTMRGEGFMALDPTAGSGGLLVAMADKAQACGADLGDVFLEGVELVPATYHMLFVQMTLRGIAGRAVCGNSLTMGVTDYAYTPKAAEYIRRHGLPKSSMRLN